MRGGFGWRHDQDSSARLVGSDFRYVTKHNVSASRSPAAIYGALLLEQGRVEEAEAVYAQGLGYDRAIPRSSWHPGNVWSPHGYHECLLRLGKPDPARIVKQQLDVALARADVPIMS